MHRLWKELTALSGLGTDDIQVHCCALFPARALVSSAGIVELWDANSGDRDYVAAGSLGRISDCGGYVLFRGPEKNCAYLRSIHEIAGPLATDDIRLVHEDEITSLKLSKTFIISASHDKTVKVWDFQGRAVCILVHPVSVYTAALTEDLIVTGGADKVIRLFCVHSKKLLGSMEAHADRITCSAIVTKPSQILTFTGGWDMTVKVVEWNGDSPKVARVFNHPNLVDDLTVSPEGTRLLSGACDYTARYFDLMNGELVNSITGSRGGTVESVSLSKDGSYAFLACKDGTVRFIDMFWAYRERLLVFSASLCSSGHYLPDDTLRRIKSYVL